jgi:GNAT superfamily N-acetyltransferase
MRVEITSALQKDAKTMGKIMAACWKQAYRGIIPDSYLRTVTAQSRAKRFCADIPLYPERAYWMICADGKPAGVIILAPCEDNELPDTGEIMAMYLLRPYWRTGLAQKVIGRALEWMRDKGFRQAVLWVLEDNARALKFYRKCGFAPDGVKQVITLEAPLLAIRCRRAL